MSTNLKNTNIIAVLVLLFLSLSCQPTNKNEEIWIDKTDDISLSIKGRVILEYKPDSWQKGTAEHEFWAMADDLSQYFYLRMDKPPVPGNEIEAQLDFKYNDKKKISKRMKFDTVKKDETGKIWLYSPSHNYGLVIGPMK